MWFSNAECAASSGVSQCTGVFRDDVSFNIKHSTLLGQSVLMTCPDAGSVSKGIQTDSIVCAHIFLCPPKNPQQSRVSSPF